MEGMMVGFVMVVNGKVVKSGHVCAGTRILLSLLWLQWQDWRGDFDEQGGQKSFGATLGPF